MASFFVYMSSYAFTKSLESSHDPACPGIAKVACHRQISCKLVKSIDFSYDSISSQVHHHICAKPTEAEWENWEERLGQRNPTSLTWIKVIAHYVTWLHVVQLGPFEFTGYHSSSFEPNKKQARNHNNASKIYRSHCNWRETIRTHKKLLEHVTTQGPLKSTSAHYTH